MPAWSARRGLEPHPAGDPGHPGGRNQQLRAEILVLKGQLQQLAALSAENTQLRALLNAAPRPAHRLLMAQLISVSQTPCAT